MRKTAILILTAAALFAGCASNKAAVEAGEIPMTDLPEKNGEDPFKGKRFNGNPHIYEFGNDGTVTVYTGFYNQDTDEWEVVESGKDAYSYDLEKAELYTKVISVTDPATKRVYSNKKEYESYLFETMENQLKRQNEEEGIVMDDNSRKLLTEYTKKQCRKLAERTFEEVVKNVFTINVDEKVMFLEDDAPMFFSTDRFFYSSDKTSKYLIVANSHVFQIAEKRYYEEGLEESVFYQGVPEGDDGSSLYVDLLKYEITGGVNYSITKAGRLKFDYTTSKVDLNDFMEETEDQNYAARIGSNIVISKKLHFTKVPAEFSDLTETEISSNASKRLATFSYE